MTVFDGQTWSRDRLADALHGAAHLAGDGVHGADPLPGLRPGHDLPVAAADRVAVQVFFRLVPGLRDHQDVLRFLPFAAAAPDGRRAHDATSTFGDPLSAVGGVQPFLAFAEAFPDLVPSDKMEEVSGEFRDVAGSAAEDENDADRVREAALQIRNLVLDSALICRIASREWKNGRRNVNVMPGKSILMTSGAVTTHRISPAPTSTLTRCFQLYELKRLCNLARLLPVTLAYRQCFARCVLRTWQRCRPGNSQCAGIQYDLNLRSRIRTLQQSFPCCFEFLPVAGELFQRAGRLIRKNAVPAIRTSHFHTPNFASRLIDRSCNA